METIEHIDLEAENKRILEEYIKLRRTIDPYMKEGDAEMIKKAFEVALDAHKLMRRKSGEPYIFHPIAVAQIAVEELKVGPTAVAAALLHDVVEDTHITLEDIERDFGKSVARIVDGVTKIQSSKLDQLNLGTSQQAENFRKMVLTLSDDVRVLMVKLADRLHNMRTLDSMDAQKQLKIAAETIFIYAPLAHRLGFYKIKTELEDLQLKYANRDAYNEIAYKLQNTKKQRDAYIEEFIAPIREILTKEGLKFTIFGRPKSIYSIHNKIQTQKIPFEKIYDLFAVRIILNDEYESYEKEKFDCWRVYSLVTDFYVPSPERLRDWISSPRLNGYESLHTTVMKPVKKDANATNQDKKGQYVEVQIRSKRMDEIAEMGYAAHWKYKEKGKNSDTRVMKSSGLDQWIQEMRDLKTLHQTEYMSDTEFIAAFRNNFHTDEVFAFTPKGAIVKLKKGATVLDFAFEIHSEVGLSFLGAKVSEKIVSMDYEIHNGDQIDIITSKNAKPNLDWLKIAKTSKAIAKIKEFLRNEKREFITKGKLELEKKAKQLKLEWDETMQTKFRVYLEMKNNSDVFYDIGKGHKSIKELEAFKKYITRKEAETLKKLEDGTTTKKETVTSKNNKSDTLVIGDSAMLKYSLGKCCNPVRGDHVFGFITIKEGVKVHRTDCPNAPEMMANYGYRIIKAMWESQSAESFITEIEIVGNDRMGLVRDVTQMISSDLEVNIASLSIGTTKSGLFEGHIKFFVRDQKHLYSLIDKMRTIEGVQSVRRFDTEDKFEDG